MTEPSHLPTGEPSDWRAALNAVRPGLWLAVTLVAVAAVYSPSLGGEFVWDDFQLVETVEQTLARESIWSIATKPFWPADELDVTARNYYRPLTTLTFALDSLIHHRTSAGFRVTNLALHLLNTTLLFQFCRRLQPRTWIVALLVACWALQPRLAESVAWISGRTDTLCGTFVLGALLLWRPTLRGRVSASALLLAALLAKETAIAAVLAIMVLELSQPAASMARRVTALTIPAVAMTGYFVLRSMVMLGSQARDNAVELAARPRLVLEAVGTYAWMLLDPWQPRTQIGSLSRPYLPALGAGAVVLLVGAAFLLLQRRKIATYQWPWLVLAIVPLALVSHAIPVTLNVVAADRFLYLPTMAIVLLTLRLGYWSWRHSAVLPALLSASFMPTTARRAPDWADPILLWTRTCAHESSCNSVAMTELGNQEFGAGNFERAGALFAQVEQLPGQVSSVRERAATNLAFSELALGRYREAQSIMEGVVRREPSVPKFWHILATVQLRNGDFAAARRSLGSSLALMPNYQAARALVDQLPAREADYHALRRGGLTPVERATLRARLALLHDAERDWLAILESTPTPSPGIQDQALMFVALDGSATAVSRVLGTAEAWQQRRPDIFEVLSNRYEAATRLSSIPLDRYRLRR